MEGQPATVNGSGPTGQDTRSREFPPTDVNVPPGTDLTIEYQREETIPDPQAAVTPPDSLTEYAFLEAPRDGDELGWLAHYRVRRLIGSGGMGLVFLAEDTHLLRPVALKVIRPELAASPEAAARFTRKARAAAAIKHDHVVTIYQVGEARGVAFLAMEHLQGLSLQRWLDRGKQPSIDLILRIGREVATGLWAAHKLGLVHRDIKPANLWLEAPNGRAKILDFGQARVEREDVQITHSGAIMGTPAFMSPEQAAGEPVSASSDLFSLGCVLYRLCCGRLPFQGKTILSVLSAAGISGPDSARGAEAGDPGGPRRPRDATAGEIAGRTPSGPHRTSSTRSAPSSAGSPRNGRPRTWRSEALRPRHVPARSRKSPSGHCPRSTRPEFVVALATRRCGLGIPRRRAGLDPLARPLHQPP